MVDPVTAGVGALVYLGSKDLLSKLLGPTAEYLGEKNKGLVEKCDINLDNIFKKANEKLGDKINEPGVVSPRVLKHVIDEGRFCEDDAVAEYFAGILASSRSEDIKDDRGIRLVSILKSMSSYQVRVHFYAYYLFAKIFHKRKNISVGVPSDCQKLETFVPIYNLRKVINLQNEEDMANDKLTHALSGLQNEGLIHDSVTLATKELLKKDFPNIESAGAIIAPTLSGAELFMWINGIRNNGINLLRTDFKINIPDNLNCDIDGVVLAETLK